MPLFDFSIFHWFTAHQKAQQQRQTAIETLRFVVFDTETSGLEVKTCNLLSIGAVVVQQRQIEVQQSLELYFDHADTSHINAKAVEIHGILPHNQFTKTDLAQGLQLFDDFCSNDAILVGHHVGFDLGVLNRLRKTFGKSPLPYFALDTAVLAQRIEQTDHYPITKFDLSLDALCKQYRIAAHDRHTAAGDAYLTALLLQKLLAKLQKRGAKTLSDLLRER